MDDNIRIKIKTFGGCFRYHRKKNGMTLEELSEKLNTQTQTIKNWENDTTLPSIDKALDMMKIFGESSLDVFMPGLIVDVSLPLELDLITSKTHAKKYEILKKD